MNLKVVCEFEVTTVVGYHRFFNASNCLLLQVKSSVVHRAVILWIWPFPFLTCLMHDRHGESLWTSISMAMMTYDHISRPLLPHIKAHIQGQCCQHAAHLLFHYCLCSASTCVCTYLPAVTWPHFFVFFRLRICRHRYLLKCEKMRLLDQFYFTKRITLNHLFCWFF